MTLTLVRPGEELELLDTPTASSNLTSEVDFGFPENMPREARLRVFVEELVADYGGALDRLAD